MRERVIVRTAFLFGKLAGAFVQLRSHDGGFTGGTTEGDQDFGEFGNFHGATGWSSRFKCHPLAAV